MISIDLSGLENERNDLLKFLESKTKSSITIKGRLLLFEPGEKTLSPGEIKTLVKRFLHHKGLSDSFRVTEEKGAIKISKLKERKEEKREPKSSPPSPSETLPYFFH